MTDTEKQIKDECVRQIAISRPQKTGSSPRHESDVSLAALKSTGSQLWVDTGDLALAQKIWKSEFTALTTNNTLANQVVQSGVMDSVIQATLVELKNSSVELDEKTLVKEVGFVINCQIALRLVDAFGVKVSVELHPDISRDIEATLDFARRYYKVCPEFFIIKIPLTPEGYLSVRQLRKEEIPINFTLGFSVRQNYLAALLSNPDYFNVFLGRLNQVVKENALGDGVGVGEKVTWKTQEALNSLRDKNRTQSKLIAASIRNGEQVKSLSGIDVLTIPPQSLSEFVDLGLTSDSIAKGSSDEFDPVINQDMPWSDPVRRLWSLSEEFINWCDSLQSGDKIEGMNGNDLVEHAKANSIDLFSDFTEAQSEKILNHGKIPKLEDWDLTYALDDLMTQSALQSFTKDQAALDQRILSFIK